MWHYKPEEIQQLREDYLEFNIQITHGHVPFGSMNFGDPTEEITISVPSYTGNKDGTYSDLLVGLKNSRRKELVNKVKELKLY